MKYTYLIFIFLTILSCDQNENISVIPTITFESLEYKKSPNNISQDSLILTINFVFFIKLNYFKLETIKYYF